jgi:hypothetical protein
MLTLDVSEPVMPLSLSADDPQDEKVAAVAIARENRMVVLMFMAYLLITIKYKLNLFYNKNSGKLKRKKGRDVLFATSNILKTDDV